ncbi:hypothetical protein ACFVVL_09555 [Kitasatospora sp. NPDC058115]|uniref:hypothetical protein n=1 Tax=Kitasatospora sp. NPDC058115 TaxID=3346347 RepID=UPI0036DF03EB
MTHSRPAPAPAVRLALAGAVALLATACTSTTSESHRGPSTQVEGVPPVSAPPTIASAADRALPIDPYLLSYEQRDQLERAASVLVSRCMARFGIQYQAPPQMPAGNRPRSRTDRRYLEMTAAGARANGYHGAEGDRPTAAPPPPPLSDATRLVLTGSADANAKNGQGGQDYNGTPVPKGGCLGESKDRLGAGPANNGGGDAQLARDIDAGAREKSKTDERVLGVFRSWSACMRTRGYDYPDPIKVLDDPRWASPAPTEVERATAVADVACKEQTNVVGVWFAVEAAYESLLIEQNAPALAQIRKDNEDRLRTASRSLAAG